MVQTMLHGSVSRPVSIKQKHTDMHVAAQYAIVFAVSRGPAVSKHGPANVSSNFFMDKAFDEQVYKTSDQILPYEDYANGKARRGQDVAGDTGTVMRVLRRNRSKRVDLFLDWLVRIAVSLFQFHLSRLTTS